MITKLSLENLIKKAISKVNGKNENSIGRFLPAKAGGYMHHFTLRKMKLQNPEELYDLIHTHIILIENPQEIPVKPLESSYASREKKLFTINETEMDRIICLARQAQDIELLQLMQRKQASDLV